MAQIYITSEQAHRLSALACDALVGLQIESGEDTTSSVTGVFVDFNQEMKTFSIAYDGSMVVS